MNDSQRLLINVLVPGLLSIGGIIFLLLAFTRQVGQREVVPHVQRRFMAVGLVLLVAGVALYVMATGLGFLLALERPTEVALAVPSNTPAPTVTRTPTLSLTDVEGTLQAEAGVVATEIAGTAGALQRQTAVVLTADALIALPATADARATAGARLTETLQARLVQVTATAARTLTGVALDQTLAATLATATPTPTRTPTDPASATPLSTSTPLPTSSALADSAGVTFRDDFDRQRLTAHWGSNGVLPDVREDRLVFTGIERWGDLIARTGIQPNEGILLLFRFSGGQMEIFLEAGQYGDPGYRRWGFMRHRSGWETASTNEDEYTVYEHIRLESWIWYYLLLRVEEDGRFVTQVWERDDPAAYIVNFVHAPEGDDWDDRFWRFVAQVYNGTLEVDAYEELVFPRDYENPVTPPQSVSRVN